MIGAFKHVVFLFVIDVLFTVSASAALAVVRASNTQSKALAVSFDTARLLTSASFPMLHVLFRAFLVRWFVGLYKYLVLKSFRVSFFDFILRVVNLCLKLTLVVATVAPTSWPAMHAFSETLAIQLQALWFGARAFGHHFCMFMRLRILRLDAFVRLIVFFTWYRNSFWWLLVCIRNFLRFYNNLANDLLEVFKNRIFRIFWLFIRNFFWLLLSLSEVSKAWNCVWHFKLRNKLLLFLELLNPFVQPEIIPDIIGIIWLISLAWAVLVAVVGESVIKGLRRFINALSVIRLNKSCRKFVTHLVHIHSLRERFPNFTFVHVLHDSLGEGWQS